MTATPPREFRLVLRGFPSSINTGTASNYLDKFGDILGIEFHKHKSTGELNGTIEVKIQTTGRHTQELIDAINEIPFTSGDKTYPIKASKQQPKPKVHKPKEPAKSTKKEYKRAPMLFEDPKVYNPTCKSDFDYKRPKSTQKYRDGKDHHSDINDPPSYHRDRDRHSYH